MSHRICHTSYLLFLFLFYFFYLDGYIFFFVFWQESATILAKLLLPQIFEKMAMQDMRTLVAERSIMSIRLRGETIEIPQHSIGLLLEGFVKTQVIQEELITSPAALLPSYGDLNFLGSETSGD